jgi:glycosyltransferase involved in cell wall biosynthesis
MAAPAVTVIATTYNQPVELELYLSCLARQTHQDFELLLADDGSGEETRRVVERHAAGPLAGRLRHIWQEDVGYRKSRILNAAIREARSDWLVFTDSDLLIHPRFLEDHLTYAAPNSVFMGRRVDLGPQISAWVRAHPAKVLGLEFQARVLASAWGRDPSRNVQRGLRLTSPVLARLLRWNQIPDLLGSNFSICRELLVRVNGFDESSEHYWGDRNSRAKIGGRKGFAGQWHLWHPQRKPKPDAEAEYLRKLGSLNYVRCPQGLVSFPVQ